METKDLIYELMEKVEKTANTVSVLDLANKSEILRRLDSIESYTRAARNIVEAGDG